MSPRRRTITRYFLVFCCLAAAGIEGCTHPDSTIEVTERDFISLSGWRSTDLSFFGIRLGEDAAQARRRISELPFKSKSTPGAFNLFDQDLEVATIVLGAGQVSQIRLFPRASVYLAGQSRELFLQEIGDADSSLRRRLLGREDDVIVEQNSTVTSVFFVYGPEGVEVERSTMRIGWTSPVVMVSVKLVAPEKARAIIRAHAGAGSS